jgi:coproporphyrinogen III oxidase-like Fe-S oxidoreductase
MVGFYTATVLKNKVRSYITELKNKIGVPIIIGGPGSINGREYLEAGCDTLSFGLQLANPEMLKNIKRYPEEPAELEKTIKLVKKKGFLTFVSFIFGLPGETRDTIRDTINYCCRVRPTYVEFYNLDVWEGSEIEAIYKTKENVCEISKEELDKWCRYAAKKFYRHPRQLMDIMKIIITRNPYWLWIFFKNIRHFIKIVF